MIGDRRWFGYLAGAGLIAVGLSGLLADSAKTAPVEWALWIGGGVLAHDLVVAPLVLGTALLVTRVPAPLRRPLQCTLVVAGCVAVVALPLVLR